FRLVINNNDEEALKRIINIPARGIGKSTVEKLVVAAADNDASVWSLLTEPEKYSAMVQFNSGIRSKLNEFMTLIRSFSVKVNELNAYDLASSIASSSALLKELYDDKTPEGVSRYENVQELLNAIKEFTVSGKTALPAPEQNINDP